MQLNDQFNLSTLFLEFQYKLDLNTEVHKVSFDISRQKSGVYIGKYVVNGVVINTQKIIIE